MSEEERKQLSEDAHKKIMQSSWVKYSITIESLTINCQTVNITQSGTNQDPTGDPDGS